MKRFFRFFLHLNFKTIVRTIRQALQRRLMGLSAEIAFNVMLSLFPIIIMMLTALGIFTEQLDETVLQLATYYREVMPISVWKLLQDFAGEISKTPSKGLFSASFVATIWVSSGALSAAMNALDLIHEIPQEQRRPFWKAKLISIFITVGAIALLIFASFLVLLGDSVVRIGLDLLVRLPVDRTGVGILVTLWRFLSFPLALGFGAGVIAMLLNIITSSPDRRHPWRKLKKASFGLAIAITGFITICFVILFIQNLIVDREINYDLANVIVVLWRFLSLPVALMIVSIAFAFIYSMGSSRMTQGMPILPGAIMGAVSWAVISSLFRLYVANFGQYNRVYGAVGTAIILMLWLQLSALVMLLGDQFNVVVGEEMLQNALSKQSPLDENMNVVSEAKKAPLREEAQRDS